MNRRTFLRSLGIALLSPVIAARAVAAIPKPNRVVNPDMVRDYTAKTDWIIPSLEEVRASIGIPKTETRRVKSFHFVMDPSRYEGVDKWRAANGHMPYQAIVEPIYE